MRRTTLLLLVAAVAAAAPARAETVSLRWLGVAGFAIEAGEDTLLHDPYLSRPGLFRTLFRRYVPDAAVLDGLLAEGSPAPELARADLVLVGHSHFDHLGDAPYIAERTGAVVVGSETTVAISRGFGLPDAQLRRADPGDRLSHGGFDVRVVESRHVNLVLGRPPFQGEVTEPPEWPLHAYGFKLGDARGYLVTHRESGRRIFLLSSAGLHPPALDALAGEGLRVDVLLTSMRARADDFVPRLMAALRPRLVVPQHVADFFLPLSDPEAGAPVDEEDLVAFEAEVAAAAAERGIDTEVRRPRLFETIPLP